MMKTRMKVGVGATAMLATIGTALALAGDSVVTFENGDEGWSGPGGSAGGTGTFIDQASGNPAPGLHTIFNDFGVTFRTSTNPDFVRDYSGSGSVTFSIDVKVNLISFFGTDTPRPWLLDLRDVDSAVGGYPWSSVWYKFADISAAQHGEWTTFSVTIEDPTATDLPQGWQGYGAEDPNTFAPILPEGVTFAQILAGVDEVAFTTFEPGFFFGFTDHDIEVDNISVAVGGAGCNAADIAEPFGVLDLGDLQAFIAAFLAGDPAADVAEPFGVFDLADVQGFIGAFNAGCP
jgi:hypothetical protein